MTIKKTLSSFFIALLVLSTIGSTIAFSEDNIKEIEKGKISKEHTMYVNGEDKPFYEADKTLQYKGKKYKLVKTEYKTVKTEKPISFTTKVTLKDRSKFKKEITKKINGVTYRLVAEEPNWKSKKENVLTATREYPSRNRVPQNITAQNKRLDLLDVKPGTKVERYSAPIYFYSASTDTRTYKFNGKVITLNGGSPTWSGSESDIKSYLGENGTNYRVGSITWNGGHTRRGNGYVRTATVTGSKTVPLVTATYSNANTVESTYTAKVKYVDSEYPDGRTSLIAICTYEKEGLSKAKIIAIGAGVLALALALTGILRFIRKKMISKIKTENGKRKI
ncbi:MAG: hypothetical protein SOR72_04350 [Hornefia sp.]|nr:hypothetical protein [Hornefia sp.]